MESARNAKKRDALGKNCQALKPDHHKTNDVSIKKTDLINIWYTNADVLTQEKIRELKEEIKSGTAPDIIAITEIKPKNYVRELTETEYQIEGYTFEHTNLADKGSTRGVALFVRENLDYSKLDTNMLTETMHEPKEVISIELRLRNAEKMVISNIYRSPNSDEKENENVNKFFRDIGKSKYKHQVILGDFNRKDINWHTASSTSEDDCNFIEATRDSFLTQHILTPTRGRGKDNPSILDLLFTSNEDSIDRIEMHAPLGKSDHSMIKLVYRSEPEVLPAKVVYDYAKGDYEKMRQALNIEWNNYFSECEDDIDLIWDKFMRKFDQAKKECIPPKKVKTGKKTFIYSLDRKALAKRKKKYRLWKRFLLTKDAKVYEEYCKCRNQVRRATRNAVKKQEKDIAKNAKLNSKVFWKFINSKTKLRGNIPELYVSTKLDNDEMTRDDHTKANILGNYFSSVFVKEPEWTWVLNEEDKPHSKMDLKPDVTKEIICKKLMELNVNKSPGPDNLHPRVFKELSVVLLEPLFIIFNLSITSGKIPSTWKLASITAIFKNKGSKHSAGNYRPISLTSIASKILESIIRDYVLNYLRTNDLLSNKQFGFLSGRSTVLQLLKVVARWTEILDKGGMIDVIYCDFQKAFDTVPHKRLMEVLQYYGIRDPIISWIYDFYRIGNNRSR